MRGEAVIVTILRFEVFLLCSRGQIQTMSGCKQSSSTSVRGRETLTAKVGFDGGAWLLGMFNKASKSQGFIVERTTRMKDQARNCEIS